MKKSLNPLPKYRRDELVVIMDSILDECPTVQMLVLFGPYARGDWIDQTCTHDHVTYEYASEFDLLVIVRSAKTVDDTSLWRKVEKRIRHFPGRTRTNLLVESLEAVNDAIVRRSPLFNDIKNEGIVLHKSGRPKLANTRRISRRERKHQAKVSFEQWFAIASEFYVSAESNIEKRKYALAAFDLHQAVEYLYTAAGLVFTNYMPKTHDLERLGHRAASCDPAFLTVFPQATDEQKECLDLLKRAYVDARRKTGYKIKPSQLRYLAERVQKLQHLAEKTCHERIESY